jgi:hypothetical protein
MWKYMDTFQAAAERMLNQTMSTAEFERVVNRLWPLADDASDRARNNHKQRAAALRYLIRDSDTQAAIRGTRWGGYQAITEYLDHIQPAKDTIARANRAVTGDTPELKVRAFDLLKV